MTKSPFLNEEGTFYVDAVKGTQRKLGENVSMMGRVVRNQLATPQEQDATAATSVDR